MQEDSSFERYFGLRQSHQFLLLGFCRLLLDKEVWYILHFQDITEPLYRKKSAERGNIRGNKTNSIEFLQAQYLGANDKGVKNYFRRIDENNGDEAKAIKRARNLQEKSKTSNPCENPSTDMHILITRLNSFKTQ